MYSWNVGLTLGRQKPLVKWVYFLEDKGDISVTTSVSTLSGVSLEPNISSVSFIEREKLQILGSFCGFAVNL